MKSLSLTVPRVIFICGIPGAGKTRFAEKFSETFSAPFLNGGQIETILQTSNVTIDHIDAIVVHTMTELLKTQKTIIVETNTATKRNRQNLAKLIKSHGYKPMFVWIQTDEITARQRAKSNRTISDEQFDALVKKFTPLSSNEEPVVVSGKHTYASQAKTLLKRLAEPRISEERVKLPTRDAQPAAGRSSTNIKVL